MEMATAAIVGDNGREAFIPFIQDSSYRGSPNFGGIQYTTTAAAPSMTYTANALMANN